MRINIIIENEKESEVYPVADAIHNSLTGNQDYIDSNIVLNFDNANTPQETTLIFITNLCKDLDLVSKKAKEAIDIFLVKSV